MGAYKNFCSSLFSVGRYRACFFNRVFQAVCRCQGFWFVFAVYINNQLLLPVFLNYRLQYFMALHFKRVWICLAQLFSFKLTTGQRDVRVLFPFALGLLFLFGAMYFCFTAVPPHIDLFKDPVTGMYGIIPKNIDVGAFFMGAQEI